MAGSTGSTGNSFANMFNFKDPKLDVTAAQKLGVVAGMEAMTLRAEMMSLYRGFCEMRKDDAKALGKFTEDIGKAAVSAQ